jgi:hypothetical protein
MSPPPPPRIEAQIRAEGSDAHGRLLTFTIYVLSQQFSWKLESATALDTDASLLTPDLTAAINRARDVFCVGTASFEGDRRTEEARAEKRAANLAGWIQSAIVNRQETRLFTINAGQYRGPPELESSHQRRAIVIAAEPHADDIDLPEALRSGLENKQHDYGILAALLHDYSRSGIWRLQRFERQPPRRQAVWGKL